MEDYDPDIEFAPEIESEPEPEIPPELFQHYVDLRRARQHMTNAIVGGFVAAGLGAAAWLGVGMVIGHHLAWMSVLMGGLTGGAVRFLGKGFDRSFGVAAAVLTAIGSAAGILLLGCWLTAQQLEEATFVDLLTTLTPGFIVEIFKSVYRPTDFLLYGPALVIAFLLAYRRVSKPELFALAESHGLAHDPATSRLI